MLAPLLRMAQIAWLSAPLAAGLALAACGSTGSGTASGAGKIAKAGNVASRTSSAGRGACRRVGAPQAMGDEHLAPPTLRLDPLKHYVVTLSTNCGSIAIALEAGRSPRTAASFAYLVKRGFYDQLTFHRVAAGFVIQGGDPDGDGSGGPGYTIVEPPPKDVRYTVGTVAMAKTSTDPAGASGSQFFIVTAPDAGLPPQYALVGRVVGGMATVRAIAGLPTDPPQDGAPRTPVVISKATLAAG
jgi:cyclophilin family peptidyl-prolyl cis-trans isomerase